MFDLVPQLGLQKLLSTAQQVEVMQKELRDLQPVLATTAKEVESMMISLADDKREADETKRMVEQQEKEVRVVYGHDVHHNFTALFCFWMWLISSLLQNCTDTDVHSCQDCLDTGTGHVCQH